MGRLYRRLVKPGTLPEVRRDGVVRHNKIGVEAVLQALTGQSLDVEARLV